MIDKQSAYKKISELVDRFEQQYQSYKKNEYNETQTRRDFIDPFWKALGWDIDNENNYAESYREVILEDRVKIGKKTKAPDYSFKLPGGKRLFFLEAKKPSVFIKENIEPAYQIRRYGWSAKMHISIITDFEEFAIYDCTIKPKNTDKASIARIKYFTFKEYLKEFNFIWDTFSKEKVMQGSFDKFILNDKNKKGSSSVDDDFLQFLDKWRVELAINIAFRNNNLTEDQLNQVVQQSIDRIIFLRIAEDRGVEDYGSLQKNIESGEFYKNILYDFHQADQKYNSGLFDFKKDIISDKITIDNKVIKNIITELYYPICPYEFSVISVEILGSAYEKFLGKQIILTKGGRARIEEKSEVRKAGGVYYTPEYIVEYIVKNTVAKLIENKTPKEISNLKIVDPACGSGSFLIRSYQYLLNWHKDYYIQKGKLKKVNKDNALTHKGELTIAEKKRILINNIYGVDLDSNAVEVTKLSLLLKCMEGETEASIKNHQTFFKERVLPTLDDNIKNGNSLIDLDYYEGEIDFGQERTVKPFNWKNNFPQVFKQGGFDCVIGNPPYVVQNQNSIYKNFYKWNTDLYLMFFEKILKKEVLKKDGLLGFITPRFFLVNKTGKLIREFFLKEVVLLELTETAPFQNVDTECVIVLIQKSKIQKNKIRINIDRQGSLIYFNQINKKYSLLNGNFEIQTFLKEEDFILLSKIEKDKIQLHEISSSKRGMEIGKNNFTNKGHKTLIGYDTNKYSINFQETYVDLTNNQYIRLKSFFENKNLILLRRVSSILIATLNDKKYAFNKNLYGIKIENDKYSVFYILALLNSSLLNFYYKKKFSTKKIDLFPEIQSYLFNDLPIANPSKKEEIQIIKSVDLILQLNKDLQNKKLTSNDAELIKRRIAYTEDKINQIVYQLYRLTGEEIKIVEGE